MFYKYVLQAGAPIKYIFSYAYDILRDRDARQAGVAERIITDTGDTVRDIDARQAAAGAKRPMPILVTLSGISMLVRLLQPKKE